MRAIAKERGPRPQPSRRSTRHRPPPCDPRLDARAVAKRSRDKGIGSSRSRAGRAMTPWRWRSLPGRHAFPALQGRHQPQSGRVHHGRRCASRDRGDARFRRASPRTRAAPASPTRTAHERPWPAVTGGEHDRRRLGLGEFRHPLAARDHGDRLDRRSPSISSRSISACAGHRALPQGVSGEAWQVHGGGFYHLQKYNVAPAAMPEELHWFKWESYWTWISGFALLCVLYYADPELYLIDRHVLDLPGWGAIAIGIGVLVVGWLVYDGLCRSPSARDETRLGVAVFVFLVALAYGLTFVFSGRGVFIHVGAVIGTMMTGSVAMVIIPNQRKVVAALKAGETPDARLGREAKTRSTHNNYLTLPGPLPDARRTIIRSPSRAAGISSSSGSSSSSASRSGISSTPCTPMARSCGGAGGWRPSAFVARGVALDHSGHAPRSCRNGAGAGEARRRHRAPAIRARCATSSSGAAACAIRRSRSGRGSRSRPRACASTRMRRSPPMRATSTCRPGIGRAMPPGNITEITGDERAKLAAWAMGERARTLNILSIQSHVSYGHVGNSAAVFAMQRLGIEAWPVNTVAFSNHPGHGGFTGRVIEPAEVASLIDGIAKLGAFARCDGVLSGYLGAARDRAPSCSAAVEAVRKANPAALFCCDPVIGDAGTWALCARGPAGIHARRRRAGGRHRHAEPVRARISHRARSVSSRERSARGARQIAWARPEDHPRHLRRSRATTPAARSISSRRTARASISCARRDSAGSSTGQGMRSRRSSSCIICARASVAEALAAIRGIGLRRLEAHGRGGLARALARRGARRARRAERALSRRDPRRP